MDRTIFKRLFSCVFLFLSLLHQNKVCPINNSGNGSTYFLNSEEPFLFHSGDILLGFSLSLVMGPILTLL